MNVRTKLAAFGLVLVATFGGAFALGTAVGPIDDAPASDQNDDSPVHEEGH